MEKLVYACILAISMMSIAGLAQTEGSGPVICLMVEADLPASPTPEQGSNSHMLVTTIYNEINRRDLGATFVSNQDIGNNVLRLRLADIGLNPNFELAMSGNNTDDLLSTKSYSEQKAILERSKLLMESCMICDYNSITVRGFWPQYFDQNEDTYQILDELGIVYNAGFQAGIIYAPGHENDVWPYAIEGHDFYAVPISTYAVSDELVPLYDRYFDESGMTSDEWYDALEAKFDESQEAGEPMVILLTASISASGDYFDAMSQFLDYAVSKDASFVTTLDLINMQFDEDYQSVSFEEECVECGDDEVGIYIESETGSTTAADNATAAE